MESEIQPNTPLTPPQYETISEPPQPMTRKQRRALRKQQQKEGYQTTYKKQQRQRLWLWSSSFLGIATIIVGMFWLVNRNTTPNSPVSDGSLLNIQESDWIKGSRDATITLIEYSDFQCPACGFYYPLVKRLHEEFPDNLVVAYRHFPLTSIHPNAKQAAQAAEAAGKQNKFWEMHDLLFERQKEWSPARNPTEFFTSYAKELELNVNQFETDLKSNEMEERVEQSTQGGLRVGINSTPTFFLNGNKIRNPASYEALRQLIIDAQNP